MTQGKHFAAGGDHFAALPSKKIPTPKGIARLTVTAATMAAMTGSSLISPFTAFAQTGAGGTPRPAVLSPIAAHAGAAAGTGAKSAAQTIADLQKAVDEAKAKEDAAKASYDEAAGPYNEAASARDQAKASYDSAVSAGTAADRAAMDEYARQVAEGKDAADAAGGEHLDAGHVGDDHGGGDGGGAVPLLRHQNGQVAAAGLGDACAGLF